MKNRYISFALCAVMICLALSGCSAHYGGIEERTDGAEGAFTGDILPESQGNAYGIPITATLYYRYLSEDLLAGVEQEFRVTAENTLEELVVQALIDGPQDSDYRYNSLIVPETRLISVKEQSGYLSVTLSSEFTDRTDQDIGSEEIRRRLAVQSIVNSITAIGNYSRVLVLIDENGTGNGQRMTYAQAGWEDLGDRTIEPMEMDTSVILTPENVMDIAMSSLVEKDYERLEYFLAGYDYDGTAKPTFSEFSQELENKVSIVSYAIDGPAIVAADGKRAVVTVSVTYIDAGGKTAELSSLPIRMLREDVWKVSYPALSGMIPEY